MILEEDSCAAVPVDVIYITYTSVLYSRRWLLSLQNAATQVGMVDI